MTCRLEGRGENNLGVSTVARSPERGELPVHRLATVATNAEIVFPAIPRWDRPLGARMSLLPRGRSSAWMLEFPGSLDTRQPLPENLGLERSVMVSRTGLLHSEWAFLRKQSVMPPRLCGV
jgi:hypothetical protein